MVFSTTFVPWLGDAVQLAAVGCTLLLSLMVATWWGELAGIAPGRNKSGLGGFAFIYLFFGTRWLLGAGLLLMQPVAANVPGGRLVALLAHLLLGVASVRLFERGLARVQRDERVPLWLGIVGSTLLPLPLLAVVSVGCQHACFGAPWLATTVVAGLHLWGFWQRRLGMRGPR